MGLLKHVVLPAFGLLHAASLAACKDLKSFGGMIKCDDVTAEDEKSTRQNHMLGIIRGFNLAMLTLCGFGIFGGKASSSDTRQAIAVAEFALFSVVTFDAYKQQLNYYIPGAQALLALGGTIVSFMEPGIFTKDHNVK
ncbi:hypothetical protein IV203_034957 [Nitzschia inconspicua]|uniref:Uncharacterized protein n=1 Tax=Nitzschia inconspicua TaxID=303405 RepID=A0A9K3LDS7_9STRA|nr:hypothetical protein IV203_034957 [Nitzschia inconspicua]